ncbi:MAG: hypothetical protein ACKO1U_08755 [Bacteroidota bacterium]
MDPSDFSIDKYRHDLGIVRETAEQVIRDFHGSAVEITFSGDPFRAYDELLEQLIPAVESLYKQGGSRLSALLYRIDLEERAVRALPGGPERYRKLSELILQREFKKVLIRHYFKDKFK